MPRLFIAGAVIAMAVFLFTRSYDRKKRDTVSRDTVLIAPVTKVWIAPDTNLISSEADGPLIRYGRSLVSYTAAYFGPKGKLTHGTNGMSCQNCHLEGGSKPWGNNYSAVYSTYPKFRERLGAVESVAQRINDCFERSLNGMGVDTGSREMRAIIAYMKWLGKDVPKGKKPTGSGLRQLKFMDRAADLQKGRQVYEKKCMSCHGPGGKGEMDSTGVSYRYPPLWGSNSYNIAAGLYRLSRFAGYVKDNMPFGSSYKEPQLTDEEAWDVAAFVNSQPHPYRDIRMDWPDRSLKPVDHPFGPYTDSFSEQQHKYGPYAMILKARDRRIGGTKVH